MMSGWFVCSFEVATSRVGRRKLSGVGSSLLGVRKALVMSSLKAEFGSRGTRNGDWPAQRSDSECDSLD
jgi:hypothetical protein